MPCHIAWTKPGSDGTYDSTTPTRGFYTTSFTDCEGNVGRIWNPFDECVCLHSLYWS